MPPMHYPQPLGGIVNSTSSFFSQTPDVAISAPNSTARKSSKARRQPLWIKDKFPMNVRKVILAGAAAMALAIPAAHAQFLPQQNYGWNHQTFGNQTFSYGTGGNQGWSGNTMGFGNQTFSTFNGPGGQVRNCNSMRFGTQTFTNCN